MQPKSSRRQIWLEAEHYHIAEVPEIYHPHPEGLPTVGRNCLLVGYPGVGKTMVLKKLCYDLSRDPRILPIYVQIEPWVARVSAETTFPMSKRQTPRDRELLTCTTILLALAVIERLARYADYEFAQAAAPLFPGGLPPRDALPKWIGQQISLLKAVLEDGDCLPQSYISFPSLFEIVDSLGDAARRQDKTLALLIDQVDKTTAVHFDVIGSLLRRGSYVVTIATRPCPCAPEVASVPHGLVAGNDYMIHWLGCDARAPSWRKFIAEIIKNGEFNETLSTFVLDRVNALTSMVGPSTRTVLQVCMNVENRIALGALPDRAWLEEVPSLLHREEAVASEVMGAWCGDPRRLIARLRERTASARSQQQRGPGPAVMHISRHDLFHSQALDALLRICTREGFFLPMPRQQVGLDLVVDRYEISPLLIAPRDLGGQATFDDDLVDFEVAAADLEKWIVGGHRPVPRAPKAVFVPYWMSEPRMSASLPERLRKGILGKARIITGDHAPGSPQWSPAIRNLVKGCDLVVVDVTTPRREVFVEWGWAIGAKKQVLLGASALADRDSNPAWVRERQIRLFGSDTDFDEFLNQLLNILDSYADRIAAWIDDPSNETVDYKPSPQTVALIGNLQHWGNLANNVGEAAKETRFSLEALDLSNGTNQGGILFDTIRLTRKAATLILAFDGSESDLLLCVAGGIFTMADSYRIGGRHYPRKLILMSDSGMSSLVPGLLVTKPGVHSLSGTQDALALIRSHFARVNALLSAARAPQKERRGAR